MSLSFLRKTGERENRDELRLGWEEEEKKSAMKNDESQEEDYSTKQEL